MTAQPKFYLFDAGVYYHLRPRGPLDSPDEIGGMALEVKNAKQIHPKSLRSPKTFQLDYPEASALLLYRGTEKLMVDGILCCLVDDFLLQLKPNHWLNRVNNVKTCT